MKILLQFPIEVAEDGKHCGGCSRRELTRAFYSMCFIFGKTVEPDFAKYLRLPACLKAEAEAKEKA